MDILPINIEELIHSRSIESIRIEYKATWNETIKMSVGATICAFANDILNLNGGYIILGIAESNGKPLLPPKGLDGKNLEKIQQQIRVVCKKIDPEYQPLIVPLTYEGKDIIVIWVPGGDNRPYKFVDIRNKGDKAFYVRQGSETVKATNDILRQLFEITAKVPFDDRQNLQASILDLSPILVKRYLSEVKSDLLLHDPPLSDEELYLQLRIVKQVHDYLAVKNCGLLFFNEQPHKFFEGAYFEVVQFGDDAGGNLIEEKKFIGPLNLQIQSVIEYLDNMTNLQLMKVPHKAQVEKYLAYPYEALEESVVNAAYHRSYDNTQEPTKIYLYPDRLEIISYPGPVQGIEKEQLEKDIPLPPVPARNRRIGEFLKELRLAEMRGTGIPKIKRTMKHNGSPPPIIDFDSNRTYFRVILPAHPRYIIVHALRESAYLWSIGEKTSAINILDKAFSQNNDSGALAGQLIEYYFSINRKDDAYRIFDLFHRQRFKREPLQPYVRFFKILISNGFTDEARKVLLLAPEDFYDDDPYEIAIAFKRLNINDKAHLLLSKIYSRYDNDPYFLHDLAKVKIDIANKNYRGRDRNWALIRRLRIEAIELLRKAINLFEDKSQKAWCWFDLARTLQFSRQPTSSVEEAYKNAMSLLPEEKTFKKYYDRWKDYIRNKRVDLT